MATVLRCCRERSNAGQHEQQAAWEQCHTSLAFAMQSAQLPTSKDLRPEFRDRNARVV
jgi:hypothetical protein